MPFSPPTMHQAWEIVTHLGSASLVAPTLVIAVIGLWQSGQRAALRTWLIALSLAVALALASKLLFYGWGLGIAALDFTGVSGHALLASAVLPVLFSWLLAFGRQGSRLPGALCGGLLAILVGISRVVLGAHSLSEVAAAWGIGLAVSVLTLATLQGPGRRPWFAPFAPLVLLLAFGSSTSTYLPTHDWEVRFALYLSGRPAAYTRQIFLAPPPAAPTQRR